MEQTIDNRIAKLNARLVLMSARERIEVAFDEYGDDLILTTSMGKTAGVMLKLAADVNPDIRVITIRHGYESPLTLKLAERYREKLGLNLHVYEAPKVLIPEEGTPEFEAFKHKVKIEPFRQALAKEQPRAWLSGVMSEENETRTSFSFANFRDGLAVIYPILDWTEIDAEEYCLAHGLPLNQAYFDPTKGLSQKAECGLHLGKLGSSWTSSGL